MSEKYTVHEYAISRVRYYDGLFMMDSDFIAEQAYHIGQSRRHERLLHVSGITDGLNVSLETGGLRVVVSPGSALDAQGRHILLRDPRTIEVGAGLHGVYILELIFVETESEDADGVSAPSRFTQKPSIALVEEQTPASIELAKISVMNGKASSVDASARVYGGARFPAQSGASPITLRARSDGSVAELSAGLRSVTVLDIATDLAVAPAVHLAASGGSYFLGGSVAIGATDPSGYKLWVTGTFGLSGDATVGGALTASGATKLGSTLEAKGATKLGSTLEVIGATSLFALSTSGAGSIGASLEVKGATKLGSTLDVTGVTKLGSTLEAKGATKLGSTLEVTGATSLSSLSTSGAGTIGTTFEAKGATKLGGALSVAGATTLSSDLSLSGDRGITFDGTSTGSIIFNSKVNAGSDKAFILFKDNSAFVASGTENARLSLGVYNDFGHASAHGDSLDIQGGAQLTLNAGGWDSELNTTIGTPGVGSYLKGISLRVNNSELMKLNTSGLTVTAGTKVTGIPVIDMDQITFEFSKRTGSAYIWTKSVTFDYSVKKAYAAITSWELWYDDRDVVKDIQVETSVSISDNTVSVKLTAGMKDNTGSYDDKYSGNFRITVIAVLNHAIS